MRAPLLAAGAAVMIAIGVLAGALLWRTPRDSGFGIRDSKSTTRESNPAATMPAAGHDMANMGSTDPGAANHEPTNPQPPIPNPDSDSHAVVTLTPEMVMRAGIKTVAAVGGSAATSLHIPGIVEPNAYKNVDVTSLVSGRVTQVRGELGQQVMPGELLATIYSPELADAQTAFMAARDARAAHGLALTRAQRLYAIGAASRQELEKLDAEASEMNHMVETARARLVLLGIPEDRTQRLASPADVVTTFDVKAPIAGVITKRATNMGLNVDMATPLFTVTDLSTVWVIGGLYERDFAGVSVGSPAMITTPSYPGLDLRGRVNYIDPQVDEQTRTAKLRVEVPNAGARLRLGMFVDVSVAQRAPRAVVLVPKTALQVMGTQSVVYVADPGGHGRFMQREVQVGDTIGSQAAILNGVQAGDLVVTEGAFFLRAEHERSAPDNSGTRAPAGVISPATMP